MAAKIVQGTAELRTLAGQELGVSDWMTISQQQITAFADATLDHQWIHINPERAAKESPFGTTIAHGYLTLSLIPHLLEQIVAIRGVSMAVNYGLNKLRFTQPVPSGARVRLRVNLEDVADMPKGVQCQLQCTVEVEGNPKPAMVAQIVFLYFD
ncbi:MAG: MaoC family dehydratase [Myxococcales bacterium]|nr:MaoC family dehydratase [Myxococcales bacterium]